MHVLIVLLGPWVPKGGFYSEHSKHELGALGFWLAVKALRKELRKVRQTFA